MKTLVVLPSYNESNDITDLIEKISNLRRELMGAHLEEI